MNGKPRIMVVDDEKRNLSLMEAMLLPLDYEVILAQDGKEALERVRKTPPDLILLDIMMPRMDGFELGKRLKENEETSTIPIVMVTALKEVENRVKALEVGADDFLSKPVDKTELRARVKSLLKVKAYSDHMQSYQKELEAAVARRSEELRQALEKIKVTSLDTIYRLSRAAECKDEETGAHIKRMSHYSAAIVRKMGLDDESVESILYASPMHDVGKIGIPDRILWKHGKLDLDEWQIMEQHTVIGAQILENSDAEFIKLAGIIALSHHEKWDGSGYPRRLKGLMIPVSGRIVAVADVFDALTSERPYKEPFSIEKSFNIIKQGRGSHFDPEVVDAFFAVEDEILAIKKGYKDEDESLLLQMVR